MVSRGHSAALGKEFGVLCLSRQASVVVGVDGMGVFNGSSFTQIHEMHREFCRLLEDTQAGIYRNLFSAQYMNVTLTFSS